MGGGWWACTHTYSNILVVFCCKGCLFSPLACWHCLSLYTSPWMGFSSKHALTQMQANTALAKQICQLLIERLWRASAAAAAEASIQFVNSHATVTNHRRPIFKRLILGAKSISARRSAAGTVRANYSWIGPLARRGAKSRWKSRSCTHRIQISRRKGFLCSCWGGVAPAVCQHSLRRPDV